MFWGDFVVSCVNCGWVIMDWILGMIASFGNFPWLSWLFLDFSYLSICLRFVVG